MGRTWVYYLHIAPSHMGTLRRIGILLGLLNTRRGIRIEIFFIYI